MKTYEETLYIACLKMTLESLEEVLALFLAINPGQVEHPVVVQAEKLLTCFLQTEEVD